MTRNPQFVAADTLAIEALQKMVQGKFRHLPVVEDGEVIAMLDIAKCLYDAISRLDKAAEQGSALAAAVEGVERQLGGNSAPYTLIETLRERMLKPSLSTIITESTKVAIVSPSDPVYVATRKMRELHVNSVVITTGNSLQGIFTSKDVIMRVVAQNLSPELTLVEKVMTVHTDYATLDTSILDALHIMRDGKFSHIPVVDGGGRVVACLDVLQLTHAAISMVQGGPVMQNFWDSAHALEPPDEEFDSHRIDKESSTPNVLEQIILDKNAEPTNLPFALLQDITGNFSDERKIGRGGFGVVYKGVLQKGYVAVKKLLNSHTIEEEPFNREANFLMNVKHPNIVRFLGFCAKTENQAIKVGGSGTYDKYIFVEMRERLLCFEYISKGSLDNHLTDELRGLEWSTRYHIIKGICKGLQYLHAEKGILHMDLKPQNILLDDLMLPKITDFGISKHLDGISRSVTKEGPMSLGYCAPEYIHRGVVSFKSDIYSLGVIITELVTGRKEDPNIKNVLRRWRYRWNKSAKHPPFGYQQVTKCIEIAVKCMAEDLKRRPFIRDIVSVLNDMESTNTDFNDANESIVDQISPYPWELLDLDTLELHFPFEPNKEIAHTLQLSNERDDYIAFSIDTINTHYEYRIEPDKDVVPPGSKCNVTITLEPQNKAPEGVLIKDELTGRMASVEDGLTHKDITRDMFDEDKDKVVDEVDLAVVFLT